LSYFAEQLAPFGLMTFKLCSIISNLSPTYLLTGIMLKLLTPQGKYFGEGVLFISVLNNLIAHNGKKERRCCRHLKKVLQQYTQFNDLCEKIEK
jgi:hypothetical protein